LSLSKAPDRNTALFSVLPGYSDAYSQSSHHLPSPLQGLYCSEYFNLNYSELLDKTKEITWDPIQQLQLKHLEELSRGQANNKQWSKYRAGQITASVFYQVLTEFCFPMCIIYCVAML